MKERHQNTNTDLLLRISTQEIDATIDKLQTAFGNGQLDEEEFEDRMSRAIAAKTKGDLVALVADLDEGISVHGKTRQKSIAIFSGLEQKGHFILPARYRVVAVLGGVMLDLREATFESAYTEIRITAVLGGVQILVPRGIRVLQTGLPILGGISQDIKNDILPVDAPTIRIFATAVLGGIEVTAHP